MTLTSKIRWYLVLIAILPVLIVMVLTWHQLGNQAELEEQRLAQTALDKYQILERSVRQQLQRSVTGIGINKAG